MELIVALTVFLIGSVAGLDVNDAARQQELLLNRLSSESVEPWSGVADSYNRHPGYRSALGDPGMRSERVRVAVEGWNFCNRVGNQTDSTLSPRWADCADLSCPQSPLSSGNVTGAEEELNPRNCEAINKVSEQDNNLRTGCAFPAVGDFDAVDDPDLYAVEKEKYLASLCAVDEGPSREPWDFWMIMLKNGNFDDDSGLCPVALTSNISSIADFVSQPYSYPPIRQMLQTNSKIKFPCFGPGCMNQPMVYHKWSELRFVSNPGSSGREENLSLAGAFYGTYDSNGTADISESDSYFEVSWSKNESNRGSWIFHHHLRVSNKYPWLMLYLRADTTSGFSGGYPWDTRGMMHTVPQSPDFKVTLTLNVISGGGPQSQFYLLDIGGCWKNNGDHCNGELATDVTRYSEMIINPDTDAWCGPDSQDLCPPYHTTSKGVRIFRNDTQKFPYSAYHLYCSPYNAKYAEKPFRVCDQYSNPQAQEILQLLPHSEWAENGYPGKKGDGWIGDSRTWELDVGALSSRLYFYQDPGTPPAIRRWPSIDVGTEIYVSSQPENAEWTLSDFNVLIPANPS